MAHREQIEFCQSVKARFPGLFSDVFVLDIGSLDINGNNQHLFDNALYLGLDIALGRNVDIVAKAHELRLPDATFDVVISTECLEHDRFYSQTLQNACRLLKPGGLFVLTCASDGRLEHGTRRTTPQDAPLLSRYGDWQDYYRNLSEADVRGAIDVDQVFATYRFAVNDAAHDLYFWGRKKGVLAKRRDGSFQISPMSARRSAPEGRRKPAAGSAELGGAANDRAGGAPPRRGPRNDGRREIAEVLTPFNSGEAVQRMKIDALIKFTAGAFDFRPFGAGGDDTAVVLINSLYVDYDRQPEVWATLQQRARQAVVMALVADLGRGTVEALQKLSTVVDVFLVPTPEMRSFLSGFTRSRIDCLFDPIDFCLVNSFAKPAHDRRLKLVWFGYPKSYRQSMTPYERSLMALHEQGAVEFNIVTKHTRYGAMPSCIIHEYVPGDFPALLATFDVCVLSHSPLDLSVGTLWKSENKAVLAINRGLPTVASRTPAYERLLEACGLGEYLYTTSVELVAALRRLTSWSERHRYLSLSQEYVLDTYAAPRMADAWQQIYHAARTTKAARLRAAGAGRTAAPIHPVR